MKLPVAILRRKPRWHLICYTRGSGQYPGGNPTFTGDQPPALLVPCEDGTIQHVEIGVPKVEEAK